MVKVRWQQRPNGNGSTDGDNNLVISEVKTPTSGSIQNNLSSAFRSDDVDEEDAAALPNSSGTAAADSGAESSTNNKVEPALQDRPDPPEDDVSDDVVATPLALDDDRVKLCEEGCVSPTPIDDCDSLQDNDSNNNNERQPLRRDPSIKTQESDFTKRCLPEDTFSFLIYSDVLSRAFFLATFVFLFQIAIYGVLVYDITDVYNKKNPLKLPVNVETPVRIAEALAIVVAIITQDDVRKAVNLIRDWFDEDLVKAFPGATKVKWILSIALRAFEGLFGLVLTFFLIMRSTTVIELLLNFLAMEFVSLLDDVVFVLAREGFLGRRNLQKEAMKVSNTFYHVSRFAVESRNATFVTVLYFFTLLLAFFTGWLVIWRRQMNGNYLCHTIFTQYGDELLPMLGTFSVSGLFRIRKKSFGGRLSYRDDRAGGALLAYCEQDKRWTLSLPKDGVSPDDWNPCDWYAASSESQDFDVLTTANSLWVKRNSTKGVVPVPLSHHFMTCYDCKHVDNFCGDFGMCVLYLGDLRYIGNYDRCTCNEGYYGLRCEYAEPCPRLEINQRGEGFVKASGEYFASKYYRLKSRFHWIPIASTYNRPIYTSLDPRGDDQVLTNDTDFIIFTGVRWILSYKQLFPELKDVKDMDELGEYFQFPAHFDHRLDDLFSNYSASYVSERVQIDTPVSDTLLSMHFDEASPVGLRWIHSSASNEAFDQQLQPDLEKEFTETSFFCAVCNNSTNPCPQGAVCQSNGTCGDCPNNSSGTMCQIPPESPPVFQPESSGNMTTVEDASLGDTKSSLVVDVTVLYVFLIVFAVWLCVGFVVLLLIYFKLL